MLKTSLLIFLITSVVWARDPDGRYENSPLKPWFDQLKSSRGDLCCSVADGIVDPEWRSQDGHYQVFIEGNWIDVPDSAVVKEPNRLGRTLAWIVRGERVWIRCFMVGTLT